MPAWVWTNLLFTLPSWLETNGRKMLKGISLKGPRYRTYTVHHSTRMRARAHTKGCWAYIVGNVNLWFYHCYIYSTSCIFCVCAVAHPTTLRLSSGLLVENSPGFKPGALMACERVHIVGLPRLQNLQKYANSLKVKVNTTRTSSRALQQNAEVCFHR